SGVVRNGARTRSYRWCWTARPDLGERWPSRLVATAAADCVSATIWRDRAAAGALPWHRADLGFGCTRTIPVRRRLGVGFKIGLSGATLAVIMATDLSPAEGDAPDFVEVG